MCRMHVRFNHLSFHRKCSLIKYTNNNDTVLTLHTVSVVVMQAVLTPVAHEEAAAQVVHGALPEAENVVPATHGVHLSAAQSVM